MELDEFSADLLLEEFAVHAPDEDGTTKKTLLIPRYRPSLHVTLSLLLRKLSA